MTHFVPTWLIAIQALFMTSAQEVGEYIHEAEDFTMTFRVNEDYEAVFELSAPPRPGFSPDVRSPYYGDLRYLIRTNDDSLVTYFRSKKILFKKVKLVYKVRDDGVVLIRVKCGRSGTRRFRFKLSERLGAQRTFNWDDLLKAVKRACPDIPLVADDLNKVVFATDRTIYVPFRGTRVALTKGGVAILTAKSP
ncbi:hypothetical protein FOL46_009389 [Perkinsus olseni]|uniref:Uncharacterized protein n=2 Tax=Perkinsus olseni TaxID=32597 RepID=A0A7J6ML33_PEROL|nr:hypothetical protein FOL46_009389 [Perkinsus olseni]